MIFRATNVQPFDGRPDAVESRRRFVVRAIFLIYILSLIEGPLRKWFLPGLAGPLTLLRDPIVIMLYAHCIATGMIWTRGIAGLWLGFATFTSMFGIAQYAASGFALHHWMLGVRTYWLYTPLAFIVARAFRPNDIHAFLRLNMIIMIPYAFLVAQQYNAPPLALINRGVGGDEDGVVGLTEGVVRPFGLFTFTGPNVQFTAAMIAMFIAFYLGGVTMRYRRLALLASGTAVSVMSVLTGSRAVYFLAAAVLGLTFVGLLLARPSWQTLRRSLGVCGFVLLAGVLFVSFFPDMLEAMTMRFESAEQVEGSIWNRAFSGLFSWVDPLFTAPILGAGIGAGAPGVALFLGLPPLIYGESDLQRNVNELGVILGILMVTLRFATAGWMLLLALRLARRGEVIVLPLTGFAALPIAMDQITHSPLNAFLVWLVFGFVLRLRERE